MGEYLEYRDTGCDLFPSCLRCPFTECIEGKGHELKLRMRDKAMRQLANDGMPTKDIAAEFGISRRSVQRIIKNEPRQP